MIRLPKTLQAWASPDFESAFKQEVVQLGVDHLPLQQGLSASSIALDDRLDVMLISAVDAAGFLHIKAGLFYSGIIAGCSCADDPTPLDVNAEYCVVRIDIDKATAQTNVMLLTE